jgi:hypothetical protein
VNQVIEQPQLLWRVIGPLTNTRAATAPRFVRDRTWVISPGSSPRSSGPVVT